MTVDGVINFLAMAEKKVPQEGIAKVLAEAGITTSFTLAIDNEAAQRLRELAKQEGRTPEAFMASVLERHANSRGWTN